MTTVHLGDCQNDCKTCTQNYHEQFLNQSCDTCHQFISSVGRTKPTDEQLSAILKVCRAMSELSEIWDNDLNEIYCSLPEEVTSHLVTMSFDEMTGEWFNFYHELTQLGEN